MVDDLELKVQRKAAKKAAKEAAAAEAAAAVAAAAAEEDDAEARRQKKAAKKAVKAAVAAAALERSAMEASNNAIEAAEAQGAAEAEAEGDEEAEQARAAKAVRKAARKAAKEAVAAAEAAEEAEADESIDQAAKKAARKVAKKAAKAAEAAEAAVVEAAASQTLSKKRAAVAEEADAEEVPKVKKTKTIDNTGVAEAGATGKKSFRLFIKGLPYSVDEATLRKDFEECGEIAELQLPMNEEGKPKGFAFIAYTAKEGFEAALKFNETDYAGRSINVVEAKGDGKGKGKGKAEDWTCPECGDLVFGRNDRCRSCGAGRPGGPAGGKIGGKREHSNENTVFLRGLPFSVTEEELRKDFAECGEIERLTLPLNDEGKPKGIGFIKYKTEEGVDAALKFDSTEYGGRTINVSKAGEGGKGKDGKGKGKDGKGKGKDSKGKGKGKKGKGKVSSEAKAKSSGAIIEGSGERKKFEDSDDDE